MKKLIRVVFFCTIISEVSKRVVFMQSDDDDDDEQDGCEVEREKEREQL